MCATGMVLMFSIFKSLDIDALKPLKKLKDNSVEALADVPELFSSSPLTHTLDTSWTLSNNTIVFGDSMECVTKTYVTLFGKNVYKLHIELMYPKPDLSFLM